MKKRLIGVFDSGVGGLSALKHLVKNNIGFDIIYFGDTARVPYGEKNKYEIMKYAKQDYCFLRSMNVDAILIACGTVSSNAYESLVSSSEVPLFEIIKPTCKKAVDVTRNGKILVLGTQATINSNSYSRYIKKINSDILILEISCPLFVPLIERGLIDPGNPMTANVVHNYLNQAKSFQPDVVILGCTHYPLISSFIQNEIPEAIIVDSGREGAFEFIKYLKLISNNIDSQCNVSYYVSGSIDQFKQVAEVFCGTVVNDFEISQIDIDLYK